MDIDLPCSPKPSRLTTRPPRLFSGTLFGRRDRRSRLQGVAHALWPCVSVWRPAGCCDVALFSDVRLGRLCVDEPCQLAHRCLGDDRCQIGHGERSAANADCGACCCAVACAGYGQNALGGRWRCATNWGGACGGPIGPCGTNPGPASVAPVAVGPTGRRIAIGTNWGAWIAHGRSVCGAACTSIAAFVLLPAGCCFGVGDGYSVVGASAKGSCIGCHYLVDARPWARAGAGNLVTW